MLAAVWRIVTCPRCRGDRRVVMALIRETVKRVVGAGIETCVFTFNPRHEAVYMRLLNMVSVARKEAIAGLANAPAVLMRWDLERCPPRWLVV